jgi:glucans biosynthesis protein
MLTRRTLLKIAAAAQLVPIARSSAFAQDDNPALSLGEPSPFSFDLLKSMAADLASKPYVMPPMPNPDIVKTMNYDTAKNIKPNPASALFGNGEGPYPVTFLAVGQLFSKSVRLFALDDDKAQEILFRADYFTSPPNGPLSKLPATPAPFAGFELRQAFNKPELREHEGWARFIGASYFRGVGEANQFGLSARGIAENTGMENPEEFPDFTHFWIGEGDDNDDPVEVYALLDGPSVAGAYRFLMHRGRATTMEISCELHLRKPIVRLGIAPLTSMFWYSETVKGTATDWRPEIHDSDGLAMWSGKGEHLWRPLNDPATLNISAFEDENPRGFGLMQRDKNYDHYLDAVFYEKRPCGWVEPKGQWGKGSVQLVEIPTDNEIYDNIIAMWVPAEPNKAGQVLSFDYKLLWRDVDPFPGDLALCVATRLGAGAIQGAPRSKVLRKFLIEFKGDTLTKLDEGEIPEAVLTCSRGVFSHQYTDVSPDGDRSLWRTQFDLDPQGTEPVEMRCFLRYDGKPLTETWTYRYIPFESPVR